jgi:hypothetical protein
MDDRRRSEMDGFDSWAADQGLPATHYLQGDEIICQGAGCDLCELEASARAERDHESRVS